MIKKIIFTAVLASSLSANASIISPLNDGSWTVMQGGSEDQTTKYLEPGYGGQYFDAEYLLYKYDRSTNELSIALQTGFDITGDNKIDYQGSSYWGGDLALSFDGVTLGDSSTYEYAIDFGVATGTDADRNTGVASIGSHAEGLYQVSSWADNDSIHFESSNPFAMTSGTFAAAVSFDQGSGINLLGAEGGNSTSYYKTMTVDLDGLLLSDFTQVDAHWVMSCGNDAIDGHAVPEPSSLLLMSAGFLGVFGSLVARRKRKVS